MTRGGAVNTPAREAKGEIVYGGVLPAVVATKEDELPPPLLIPVRRSTLTACQGSRPKGIAKVQSDDQCMSLRRSATDFAFKGISSLTSTFIRLGQP